MKLRLCLASIRLVSKAHIAPRLSLWRLSAASSSSGRMTLQPCTTDRGPDHNGAFCFPHLLNLLESCSMCSPHHDGSDFFRHWLRFLVLPSPGTLREYLDPPLLRGWLDFNAKLSSVSPRNKIPSFSGVCGTLATAASARMRAGPADQMWAFFSILRRPLF